MCDDSLQSSNLWQFLKFMAVNNCWSQDRDQETVQLYMQAHNYISYIWLILTDFWKKLHNFFYTSWPIASDHLIARPAPAAEQPLCYKWQEPYDSFINSLMLQSYGTIQMCLSLLLFTPYYCACVLPCILIPPEKLVSLSKTFTVVNLRATAKLSTLGRQCNKQWMTRYRPSHWRPCLMIP